MEKINLKNKSQSNSMKIRTRTQLEQELGRVPAGAKPIIPGRLYCLCCCVYKAYKTANDNRKQERTSSN